MANKTYAEKLQDPKWQKKRLKIFERDNWKCVKCPSGNSTLHVHHTKYFANTDPWNYEDRFLETLCDKCHEKEHELIPEVEAERRYEHLIIYKTEPSIITCINDHINSLQNKLKNIKDDSLMCDILKNIIFLTNKKKELKQV